MACKIHAAMRNRAPSAPSPPSLEMPRLFALVFAGLAAVAVAPVQAEKADRFKPLNVEADLPG